MHGLSTIEALNDEECWKRYKLDNLREYDFDEDMTYSEAKVKDAYIVTAQGWFNKVTDTHWLRCNAGSLWYLIVLSKDARYEDEDIILCRLGDDTYRSLGNYLGDLDFDPKGDIPQRRINKRKVISAIVHFLVEFKADHEGNRNEE